MNRNWWRLLWWLGPWCNQQQAPKDIHVLNIAITHFAMQIYHKPNRHIGAIFVLPGLHPDGLSDTRMDRFCRVLANAGMIVGAPELPTMVESIMQPQLLEDSQKAFVAFYEWLQKQHSHLKQVGIFCISASSIAGLHLLNNDQLKPLIHSYHSFGGFSDWIQALRFAMTGKIRDGEFVQIDPLGLPVIYMNLLSTFDDFLEIDAAQKLQLLQLWRQFVESTWEKPEMMDVAQHGPIAHRLSQEILDASLQEIFLQGCSVQEGGKQKVHDFLDHYEALTRQKQEHIQSLKWLNPQPLLENLSIPVYISHGREDVVVPYPQAEDLQRYSQSNKKAQAFVTGLYHHTGSISFLQLLQLLQKIPMEIFQSLLMVRAIARTGGL